MTCDTFQRWLDRGADPSEAERSAAMDHAGGCQACASALRRWRALEFVLTSPLGAPAGLEEAIWARLAVNESEPTRTGRRTRSLMEVAGAAAVLACLAATVTALPTKDPIILASILASAVPLVGCTAWLLYRWPARYLEAT